MTQNNNDTMSSKDFYDYITKNAIPVVTPPLQNKNSSKSAWINDNTNVEDGSSAVGGDRGYTKKTYDDYYKIIKDTIGDYESMKDFTGGNTFTGDNTANPPIVKNNDLIPDTWKKTIPIGDKTFGGQSINDLFKAILENEDKKKDEINRELAKIKFVSLLKKKDFKNRLQKGDIVSLNEKYISSFQGYKFQYAKTTKVNIPAGTLGSIQYINVPNNEDDIKKYMLSYFVKPIIENKLVRNNGSSAWGSYANAYTMSYQSTMQFTLDFDGKKDPSFVLMDLFEIKNFVDMELCKSYLPMPKFLCAWLYDSRRQESACAYFVSYKGYENVIRLLKPIVG